VERAVRKYVNGRKGSTKVVLHPTTGAEYFMIITQAAPRPKARSGKSSFTWFTPCKKDGVVRDLLEEQGVKDIEYITALSRY